MICIKALTNEGRKEYTYIYIFQNSITFVSFYVEEKKNGSEIVDKSFAAGQS